MFERYTEKARRVIFFARYEASQYGSPEIDTEHLLLGLLRENTNLCGWFPKATPETLRQRIDASSAKLPSTPTSVDLPLNSAARRALRFAADEAEHLAHRHIGTEHLFLGLLDEESCLTAQLLREAGADADNIRAQLASSRAREGESFASEMRRKASSSLLRAGAVEIHGIRRNTEFVREAVQRCRMYNWQWQKRPWTNTDIIIERKTGKVSFDLKLAEHSATFELVKGGWKKDHCFVCRWELFESQNESDSEHSTGYTNGHDWLCTECYAKFFERPDFFSSSYSDIT
jgi:hypothetical protein